MSKRSGKVRRTERYRYLLTDPTDAQQAVAESRLAEIRARETPEHAEAKKRLQAAEKALDNCYGFIVLRALAPEVQEQFGQESAERDQVHADAVKAAEEAGEDLPEDPKPTWTADSFEVRFLAACDIDSEHTPKWWAAEFAGDEWTLQERDDLLALCYQVVLGRRPIDLGVLGKD